MTRRVREFAGPIGLVFLLAFCSSKAYAERIAIIGTGSVGSALGTELAMLGHEIVYGSRTPNREDVVALVERTDNKASSAKPANAVEKADIVVMAVPGLMVEDITRSLGNLEGKIIIDPTNPLIGWEENNVRLQGEESSAEIIQRTAPNAFVVKAFSTLNYKQMIQPEKSSGPISIMLAGNNAQAKSKVAELVTGLGLEPIDVGPIEYAKYVEAMAILFLNNRIQGRAAFDFHLRKQAK